MARLFDEGSAEYLHGAFTGLSEPLALAAWVYSDDDTIEQPVLTVGDGTNFDDHSIGMRGDQAGDPIWAMTWDGAAASYAATASGFTVNTWHHICGMFIASDSRTAFVDGGGKGTNDTNRVATVDTVAIAEYVEILGTTFSGSVAEAAVWDLSVWPGATAADKADAFEAIALPALAQGYSPKFFMLGLVAYWKLVRDEDQDEVGGYDLTAYNTPSIAVHPPMIYPAPLFTGFGAAAGIVTHEATAAFAGAGTLTSAGLKALLAASVLPGQGALDGVGLRSAFGVVALDGQGALTSVGLKALLSAAALPGQGALTSAGMKALLASSVLPGQGALTAAPQRIVLAISALPGIGTLVAVGSMGVETHEAIAALTGQGSLVASGLRVVLPAAALVGQGTLTGLPMLILLGATALAGIGTLTVVGTTITGAVIVELTLDTRSFLLTLPARSFELTQDTRDLGLTLEDR